jgi:hypothetical protein
MSRSWATVARGVEAPVKAPVSKLNANAVVWKPREVHHCLDCGKLAQMCENGCDRPGNRSIVPRLGRDRYGQRQWGPPKSVCAGCHYNHEHAISQMPYMDMGPLPDSDPEGKLPFLCVGCAEVRSRKEMEAQEARYLANKAKEEQIKSSIDAYLATLPKMSSSDRSEHFRIAYQAAYSKAYGLPSVRAAGGGQ